MGRIISYIMENKKCLYYIITTNQIHYVFITSSNVKTGFIHPKLNAPFSGKNMGNTTCPYVLYVKHTSQIVGSILPNKHPPLWTLNFFSRQLVLIPEPTDPCRSHPGKRTHTLWNSIGLNVEQYQLYTWFVGSLFRGGSIFVEFSFWPSGPSGPFFLTAPSTRTFGGGYKSGLDIN